VKILKRIDDQVGVGDQRHEAQAAAFNTPVMRMRRARPLPRRLEEVPEAGIAVAQARLANDPRHSVESGRAVGADDAELTGV
jgi:hypothetical protein